MNTNVSFELAKLLKEKGFDEYTEFFWDEESLAEPIFYAEKYNIICNRIHYYGAIPSVNNSYIEKYTTYVEKEDESEDMYERVSAPTIAEVVMWIYKKHDIWIYVDFSTIHKWFYCNLDLKDNSRVDSSQYNSPEEAYEAGIIYTLNNLIQTKEALS